MNKSSCSAAAKALGRAETVYRKQILQDPGDMDARLRLAWCLFLRSLHQAGRESLLAELLAAGSEGDSVDLTQWVRYQDNRNLLSECLRQLSTVSHLSGSMPDHREVEQLHGLVRLAGGESAVRTAEADATRALSALVRDLGPGSGVPLRRLRRRASPE